MPVSLDAPDLATDYVWYVAYGSNMNLDRLSYYIGGGQPVGGALTYPGCRDTTLPLQSRPLILRGGLYFALEALAWTGGMAFYDPEGTDEVMARGYLISTAQLSDIVAQEMGHETGTDLDFSDALTHGRMTLGPGCYETLLCLGHLDGRPMLTFTAPWGCRDVVLTRPVGIYLRIILTGLMEAHGWDVQRAAAYLSDCPGAAGHWTSAEIAGLVAGQEVLASAYGAVGSV